ncbi:MAG: 2-isopropylmalate synthase [Kiritimatiellae bacterium]|nr:2-isopropylmalate synthase [Kiritimatiellia bacterium]
MRPVKIFDSTLRDAEQIPGAALNPEQKMEIARQLARLKVDIIEAGFPASSPGDLQAVSAIAKRIEGVTIAGLARSVKRDIEAAWEAVRYAALARIHVFIGTSDLHVQGILRKTRPEALRMAVESVSLARELCEDVEFSPMDATRTEYDYLCEVVERTIEAGATTLNIPDTVGYAIPSAFGRLIRKLIHDVRGAREVTISVHCHNDLGLATANSLAAVLNGAGQVECCVNGLGERAGNASLEEVVMAIRTRRDTFDADTRIETREIVRTSRMVSALMGMPVQPNKAIVGANAFAHSSGIHQDGIIKNRSTFEVIKPEEVGLSEHRFVLTARSGRNALRHRLEELGYEIDDIEPIYERFIQVADRKKEVLDADLEAMMGDRLRAIPETYHLEAMEALSTTTETPRAKVRVAVGGQTCEAETTGDGPIDALFRAIKQCVGVSIRLVDYQVRSVTSGTEAMGEVTVRVTSGAHTVNATATATDVVEASARAFVNAANLLAARQTAQEACGEDDAEA